MNNGSKILSLACIAEAATGFALLAVPALVTSMLLGAELSGAALIVARVAGAALLALAVACWPNLPRANDRAYAGMLIYNVLVALWLAAAGIEGAASGRLLWPTVALHVLLTALLSLSWLKARDRPSVDEASPS